MFDEITTFWLKIVAQVIAFFCSFVFGIVAATLSVAKLIRGFEKKQIDTDNELNALKNTVADMHVKCAENRDDMKIAITQAVREGMNGMEGRWGIELAGASAQRAKQEEMLQNVQKSIDKQDVAIVRVHERIDAIAISGLDNVPGRKEQRHES